MRRGLLIVGGVLIVLGIAIFLIGIYLSSSITSSVASLVTGVRNESMIAPGSSIMVSIPNTSVAVMVIYNDTLGKPLQVVSSPGQLKTKGIEEQYVVVYIPETGPSKLLLMNNYSENVVVYYTYGTINVGSLLPLVLSTLVSIGLVIVGIILLILGAVLRGR